MPVVRLTKTAVDRLKLPEPPKPDGEHFRVAINDEFFGVLKRFARPDESYSDAILRVIRETSDA